jgi:branched-chain amino acid transport system substrate-binding protein
MVMISPSATSPALSTMEDNGLFFRTAPSDARQGVVMARTSWIAGSIPLP